MDHVYKVYPRNLKKVQNFYFSLDTPESGSGDHENYFALHPHNSTIYEANGSLYGGCSRKAIHIRVIGEHKAWYSLGDENLFFSHTSSQQFLQLTHENLNETLKNLNESSITYTKAVNSTYGIHCFNEYANKNRAGTPKPCSDLEISYYIECESKLVEQYNPTCLTMDNRYAAFEFGSMGNDSKQGLQKQIEPLLKQSFGKLEIYFSEDKRKDTNKLARCSRKSTRKDSSTRTLYLQMKPIRESGESIDLLVANDIEACNQFLIHESTNNEKDQCWTDNTKQIFSEHGIEFIGVSLEQKHSPSDEIFHSTPTTSNSRIVSTPTTTPTATAASSLSTGTATTTTVSSTSPSNILELAPSRTSSTALTTTSSLTETTISTIPTIASVPASTSESASTSGITTTIPSKTASLTLTGTTTTTPSLGDSLLQPQINQCYSWCLSWCKHFDYHSCHCRCRIISIWIVPELPILYRIENDTNYDEKSTVKNFLKISPIQIIIQRYIIGDKLLTIYYWGYIISHTV